MIISAIFLILKIIGIILLFALCAFIAISLILLCSNIKYYINFGNDDSTYFKMRISYIFGIIKAAFVYRDEKFRYAVKIGKKTVLPKKSKTKSSSVKKETMPVDDVVSEEERAEILNETKPDFSEKTVSSSEKEPVVKTEPKKEAKKEIKKTETKNIPWEERFKNIPSDNNEDFEVKRIKISDFEPFEDTKENIKEEPEKENTEETNISEEENKEETLNLKYFIELPFEDIQTIFSGIYSFLKSFLKTVLPKSVSITATTGLGNPEYTGLLLALSSIIKGMFIEKLNITGDFDNLTFNGNGKFRGNFALGHILFISLKLILIKPIRKIIFMFIKNR